MDELVNKQMGYMDRCEVKQSQEEGYDCDPAQVIFRILVLLTLMGEMQSFTVHHSVTEVNHQALHTYTHRNTGDFKTPISLTLMSLETLRLLRNVFLKWENWTNK